LFKDRNAFKTKKKLVSIPVNLKVSKKGMGDAIASLILLLRHKNWSHYYISKCGALN
jgi:hypothetical protein